MSKENSPSINESQQDSENQVEKGSIVELTEAEKDAKCSQLAQELNINERKLQWKIDLCVVPPFCLLYFLSFLDRVNIGNAKVYSLVTDLGLTGDQYNVALTIFYVPYIFFELFANYLIKIVGPHVLLSICIVSFGAISIGMGFVNTYGQLLACRFLIGMTEAGTFPAIFYILSTYYTGRQAQKRFSIFFSSTCLAGGASGAIAYKIADLDGVHGLASWRYIFIIEGAATVGLGFILFFIIPNFPEKSKFLSIAERQYLKFKLETYSGAKSGYEQKVPVKTFLKGLKDYLIWLPALTYFGFIIPSYGYAYFAPTIIQTMGYTGERANQLSVAPWCAAFVVSVCLAVLSDHYRRRFPFVIFCLVLAIVGLAMILGSSNSSVRFGGCFLTASGLYSGMPLLVCWNSINFAGHARKSLGTSVQIGFGNIGGIISTFIFLAKDAPVFRPGLSVCIASCCFAILMAFTYLYAIVRLNKIKKTDKFINEFNQLSEIEQLFEGDLNPKFKYLY